MKHDTIFALSTIRGKSALSVYRITGDESVKIIQQLCGIVKDLKHKQVFRAELKTKEGNIIDDVLVSYFKSPNSFTGEDVIEIYTHGSIAVQNQLEKEILAMDNVRYAEKGEFSRRAVLNSKMNLTQAEGLNDLINSETEIQKKQAINGLKGKYYSELENLKPDLMKILSLLEAYIDFPDEDIPEEVIDNSQVIINKTLALLDKFINSKNKGELLKNGLKLVIYGKPNTGKSSLINYLTKRQVSIVSDISGTTRDSIETHIEINGYPVILVDTAGIKDKTDDVIEKQGIEIAKNHIKDADIRIFIQSPDQLDNHKIDYDDNSDVINIMNKSDIKMLSDKRFLNLSIKNNIGLEELIDRISDLCVKLAGQGDDAVITRARQRSAIEKARKSLENVDLKGDLVLAAEDVRITLRQLSSLFGNLDMEEVLDLVFSEFCIGK